MELLLTNQEKEKLFFDSLVEIYGSGYFNGHGLFWDWDKEDYKAARAKLKEPCAEDVLMQILRDGKTIKIVDEEGEGEYTRDISLEMIYENAKLVRLDDALAIIPEEGNYDIENCDRVLQTLLFKEVVFG